MLQWKTHADAVQMGTCSAVTAKLAGSSSLTGSRCNNSLCCCCRLEYLSKFMPAPSPHVQSFAAALVQRMASRVLTFFVRHASLLRPLSDTGRLQLAKVGCLRGSPCLSYCREQAHRLDASPVKFSLFIRHPPFTLLDTIVPGVIPPTAMFRTWPIWRRQLVRVWFPLSTSAPHSECCGPSGLCYFWTQQQF